MSKYVHTKILFYNEVRVFWANKIYLVYTANDYKTIIRKFFCNFCIQENSDKTKGMFFQAM